jgi:hypothetical protein
VQRDQPPRNNVVSRYRPCLQTLQWRGSTGSNIGSHSPPAFRILIGGEYNETIGGKTSERLDRNPRRPPCLAWACRRAKTRQYARDRSFSANSLNRFFVHGRSVPDGHHTNDPRILIDGIDNAEAANATRAHSLKLARKWLSTCGARGNHSNGRHDGSPLQHAEGCHGEKGARLTPFLGNNEGAPKTSSNEKPFRFLTSSARLSAGSSRDTLMPEYFSTKHLYGVLRARRGQT